MILSRKHVLRYLVIFTAVWTSVIVLLIGLLSRLSLRDLLLAVLMSACIGSFGGLMGWLAVRLIYPRLVVDDKPEKSTESSENVTRE